MQDLQSKRHEADLCKPGLQASESICCLLPFSKCPAGENFGYFINLNEHKSVWIIYVLFFLCFFFSKCPAGKMFWGLARNWRLANVQAHVLSNLASLYEACKLARSLYACRRLGKPCSLQAKTHGFGGLILPWNFSPIFLITIIIITETNFKRMCSPRVLTNFLTQYYI
jgi:hypothetical protein